MKKLITFRFVLTTLLIALIYIVLTIYLMNFKLVRITLLDDNDLGYKVKLLTLLLTGMWTSMTKLGLGKLILSAILTGMNISLLVSRLQSLKSQGNLRLVVGGSSILGIAGSGCATCGLPILTLLGLGGSVAYLPLRGSEFSYTSIALLLISLSLLVKNSHQQSCLINLPKQ